MLGSVIAALTDSIWGIILGRALQGSGAIAAAVMALLSDLTREQNRTKAMAFIGVASASPSPSPWCWADCHPPAGSARAVLDDRHPATVGILLTLWWCPTAITMSNRESGMVKGCFRCWRSRAC